MLLRQSGSGRINPFLMSKYLQLSAAVHYELEEKRSRFLCYLYPVTARLEAMQYLKELQNSYPDARHHCWAYLIGNPQQPATQAFSDDGEPSGTAGKPILNVLTLRGAGNSCAVVVRYFGGIKLGVGGLVRAYGGVVSKALDCALLSPQIPKCELILEVPFALEAQIRHALDTVNGVVLSASYGNSVTMVIELSLVLKASFTKTVAELSSGVAIWKEGRG